MAEHIKSRAGIVGIGTYVPDRVLKNSDLEKMVDTSDEWIVERSGIRERRIAEADQSTSDMALAAARNALDDAGIQPGDVGLIIVATNTPDYLFPAVSCLVQDDLGAGGAGAFDILAGCTGFIHGLSVAEKFVVTGSCRYALVIGAEKLSSIVNWEDRNTCVLFGDGAGAVVVGSVPDGYGINYSRLHSDGSGRGVLNMPGGGSRNPATVDSVEKKMHFIHMRGRRVFKFAVRACGDGVLDDLEEAGLTGGDIDYFIPHQANIRIIEAAVKRLGISMEKVYVNVERFGNTSTASIPLAMKEAAGQGKLKDGDLLVLAGFGAGLTWATMVMRWHNYRRTN